MLTFFSLWLIPRTTFTSQSIARGSGFLPFLFFPSYLTLGNCIHNRFWWKRLHFIIPCLTFYLICKWRKAVTENGRSVSSLHWVAGHLLVFSAFQHLLEPASPAVTMHLLLFPGKFLCPLNTHRHCYNSGLLVQPDPGPFSMNSNMKLFASDSLFLCLSPLPYSYSPYSYFTLIWPPGI